MAEQMMQETAGKAIPAGYKQTEVGVIPDDWNVAKFRDVTNLITCGIAATPIYVQANQGYPFLSSTNVKNGRVVWDNYKHITPALHRRLYKNNPPLKGDVLYSRVGTIGEAAVIEDDFEFSVYVSLTLIKPKKQILDSYFISQLLNSNRYKARANEQVYLGGGVGNLNVDVVREYPIPIPPKQEQTAIANVLSDSDALIDELEQLIAKKQAIKSATMQQLLTGRTRLPAFALRPDGTPKGYKPSELGDIPDDWEEISIGQDAVLKARIGWQALTTKEYQVSGDIYLVTGIDFDAGAVMWDKCCYVSEWRYKQDTNIQLRENDVLITKDGTVGKVGYVSALEKPATLNSGVFVIRPKNNSFVPRYLFYVLTSRLFNDFMNQITAGSTITHLYQKDFVNFEFSAPNIEEQTAIATILSDMDNELQALTQKLEKARALKQGMMQQLLTGKIRLPLAAGA